MRPHFIGQKCVTWPHLNQSQAGTMRLPLRLRPGYQPETWFCGKTISSVLVTPGAVTVAYREQKPVLILCSLPSGVRDYERTKSGSWSPITEPWAVYTRLTLFPLPCGRLSLSHGGTFDKEGKNTGLIAHDPIQRWPLCY